MRNRNTANGLQVSVIMGTYSALLSITITDRKKVNRKDFLGFAIKRDDLTEKESYFLRGFKYFANTTDKFDPAQLFDTDKQPVQSFIWEDFTVKYEHKYVYHVIPVYGKPKNLTYGDEVSVAIQSEARESNTHSVYFNMGVSGSLAYARKFHNKRPDQMNEKEKAAARQWLSRGLEEALLGFIDKAIQNKFGLRIAFYEFTYTPVLLKLKEAITKGCDVQIVYDSRDEEAENDEAIKSTGLPRTVTRKGKRVKVLIRRTKDPQVPSHNKFMILMEDDIPTEVWTGSTNITDKGILGQSNVGHLLKDKAIAKQYLSYWQALHNDPEHDAFASQVTMIQNDIAELTGFTNGITVFFSPRPQKTILQTYAKFISSAQQMVCGIFPFSFNKDMKTAFGQKTDHVKYILVDKINNADGIIKQDNYTVIVNGAYFAKAMFDWLEEINAGILLNQHPNPSIGTNYVHNKLLLIDPLSQTPVIIVGSANFSDPSVASNDENTLIIKGGTDLRRISDIYFTEFYRMFHHFFVRKATQEMNKSVDTSSNSKNNPLHLTEDNYWVACFDRNTVKTKLQKQLTDMPLDY